MLAGRELAKVDEVTAGYLDHLVDRSQIDRFALLLDSHVNIESCFVFESMPSELSVKIVFFCVQIKLFFCVLIVLVWFLSRFEGPYADGAHVSREYHDSAATIAREQLFAGTHSGTHASLDRGLLFLLGVVDGD